MSVLFRSKFVRLAIFCAVISTSFAGVTAWSAEEAFPKQPVKFVVPYTPGGSNDVVARVLGEKLAKYWGQPVIVENRPGAGGNLGAAAVARARPDGYTLLITPNNLLTMNPTLYRNVGVGYDPIKDFEPISLIATAPILLAINADLSVTSVEELVKYAKDHPGTLSYASAGVGTPHHLTAELFKSMTHIEMVHIPYRGAVPAVSDLASGRVQVMFGIPNTLMPFVNTGRLRALAVSGQKRASELPNTPTIDERGVHGFDSSLWIGLTAPAGTPRNVIDKINQDVARAARDKDVVKVLSDQGLTSASSTPADFANLVKIDMQRWKKLIEERRLSAESP
ncbi:Bug family tripartite tricarboxylate transporter substrate binding protein [Pigmentiphaga litoralis]|uniref:Bug family tripartite tricarboxylate transporter substrate binding protein n=1 Tax=Pigmentiphaga litoralis TaxID=516702 RepID=UPI00389A8A56